MSESASAEIIQFPARVTAPVASGEAGPATRIPTPAEVRLARALTELSEALTSQRVAMAAWKAALGDLRTVTGRLGTSMRSYNDSLGRLDARVKTLRSDAVKLEVWADEILTPKV
jgi:hypothetical protein